MRSTRFSSFIVCSLFSATSIVLSFVRNGKSRVRVGKYVGDCGDLSEGSSDGSREGSLLGSLEGAADSNGTSVWV
jgi:hypothetical protein